MQRQKAAERHESTTITFFNIFIFFKIVKMTFSNEKTPTDPRVIEDNEAILEPEEEEDALGLGEDDRKLLSSGMATLRDSGTVSRPNHHHTHLYYRLDHTSGGFPSPMAFFRYNLKLRKVAEKRKSGIILKVKSSKKRPLLFYFL